MAAVSGFDVKFDQKFATVKCSTDVPAGYLCLHVSGTAAASDYAGWRFERSVAFNIKNFDDKHPTCLPDETSGTLYLGNDTLTFRAPGSVCLVDGTASYGLVVTGGTGRYKGAQGGGQITVPPPLNDTTGTELWHVTIF